MTEERDESARRPTDPAPKSEHLDNPNAFVMMTNAVVAGVGGLYAATQSIVVTAIGGALVALVVLMVVVIGLGRR